MPHGLTMSSAWACAHTSPSARPAAARRASRQAPDGSCRQQPGRTRCAAHGPEAKGQDSGSSGGDTGRESSGSGGGSNSGGGGSSSGGEATAELLLTYNPDSTILVAQLGPDGLEVVQQPVLASPALVACALSEYDA